MQYTLSSKGDFKTVTVLIDGELFSADSSHPNWETIVAGLDGNDLKPELFDLTVAVQKKFEQLSDRVSVSNGTIYLDGEPIHNDLTLQVTRFLDEDVDNWEPLVNFWEKLLANPNEHSRDQAYRWLADRNFTITEEGYLLAYKGVNKDDQGNFISVHSGPAIVNGETVNGYVPNNPGSTIVMPRTQVQFDSSVGCSTGLHAGTWDYASSFASNVVLVLINPRDIVSVPTDCNDQKMRVCKYEVLHEVKEEIRSALMLGEKSTIEDDVEDDEEQDYTTPYWSRY